MNDLYQLIDDFSTRLSALIDMEALELARTAIARVQGDGEPGGRSSLDDADKEVPKAKIRRYRRVQGAAKRRKSSKRPAARATKRRVPARSTFTAPKNGAKKAVKKREAAKKRELRRGRPRTQTARKGAPSAAPLAPPAAAARRGSHRKQLAPKEATNAASAAPPLPPLTAAAG